MYSIKKVYDALKEMKKEIFQFSNELDKELFNIVVNIYN
jgi:ABC-type transporter lipoprotein component MlaA